MEKTDMARNQVSEEKGETVVTANSRMSIGLVIAMLGLIGVGGTVGLVGAGVAYGRMDTKLEELLKGQNSITLRMAAAEVGLKEQELKMQRVETTLIDIDRNGTTALKDITARINSFAQKVDAFERNGSPATVARINTLDQRIDKIERDVTIHIETDKVLRPSKGSP